MHCWGLRCGCRPSRHQGVTGRCHRGHDRLRWTLRVWSLRCLRMHRLPQAIASATTHCAGGPQPAQRDNRQYKKIARIMLLRHGVCWSGAEASTAATGLCRGAALSQAQPMGQHVREGTALCQQRRALTNCCRQLDGHVRSVLSCMQSRPIRKKRAANGS